jgi:predicted negative regulator of RcsB-dependent stress response
MMPLALVGVLIMAGLVGWGVWTIAKSITFKRTTDRYRYVKTKDEDGNEITKVVDLEDEKQ